MQRDFSPRSRWWVAVVQVFLLLLTFFATPAAAADSVSLTGPQLIQLLRDHTVVRGDSQGNLNLDKSISRAEMITIMVRALGKESEVPLFASLHPFKDAEGHWAEGYIAYAHAKGLVKGDENGNARPDAKINYAEALTLLVRLLGHEPTAGTWPTNVLLAAADLKLVPDGVFAGNIRDEAVRGLIFQALAKGLLTVTAPSGKVFLAEYLDKSGPDLTVNSVTSPTLDTRATVSGSTKEAAKVTVNGIPVAVSGGSFSTAVNLVYGTNAVTIVATDLAGNETTKTFDVIRNARVTKIEVAGPTQVVIGETADITATVYDDANKVLSSAPLMATISGGSTYNVTTGKFTAGNKAGDAVITFKAGDLTKTHTVKVVGPDAKTAGMVMVVPSTPPNPNDAVQVEVRMVDSAGAVVTGDNGRVVGLNASGLAGITITPTFTKTVDGVAKFTFSAITGGIASLTAVSTDLASTHGQITVATPIRVALSATPNSLVANGASSTLIRANLLNSSGAAVTNTTNTDIVVQIGRGGVGDGVLSNTTLIIKPGKTNSEGYDALYTAGLTSGTLYISGIITAGNSYTVLGTTVTMTPFGFGGGTGSGSSSGGSATAGPAGKLQFIGSVGPEAPNGTPLELVLRVVDSYGNTVTTGNYPFTLRVTTSNNDPIGSNGLPDNVSVTMGGTLLVPVGGTSGVVGTTVNGLARVRVGYTRSGKVRIEPVGANATTSARDDQGNLVSTNYYSTSLSMTAHEITFSSGADTWSALQLKAGYTNTTTAMAYTGADNAPAPLGAAVTLTASLFDADGGLVPNGQSATVSLYKLPDVTTPVAVKSVTAGTVDFAVTAPSTAGSVQYRAVAVKGAGTVTSGTVTIHAVNAAPTGTPTISAVRGAYANGTAHDPNRVALDDSYLQFLVQPNATGYGVIRVYRVSTGSFIYTSNVRDLSTINVVDVPKNLLSNQDQYRIYVDNGYGNSASSVATATVAVNSLGSVGISGVYYDAATHQLTISTNGSGYNSSIYPTKLTLTAPGGATFTPSVGKVDGTGNYVINLTTDLNLATLENTSLFNGDVRLTAAEGWYERYDGLVASAVTTSIGVYPFATITKAYLDVPGRRLIIDTAGTTSGNFNLGKIFVGATRLAAVLALDSSSGNYSMASDSSVPGRYVIALRNLTAGQVTALESYNGVITAEPGWYYYGSYQVAADTAPVLSLISVTSASYNSTTGVLRINGSGFTAANNTGIKANEIQIVNEAPNPDTSVLLDDPANVVTIVNDNTITITIGGTDKAAMDALGGSLVFLRTTTTWLTDRGGRNAPQVTNYQCGVGFSNN